MWGSDTRSGEPFSYVDLERRVRSDHPLRVIRTLTGAALQALSGDFAALYSGMGRSSISPEQLLRAMLLQPLYSIRPERLLMERLEYDLLFKWFVGLGVDDTVWDRSTFSKNRDRLLAGEIAAKFLNAVLAQPRVKRLLSSEHFSVDGTLIEPRADRPLAITLGADKSYDAADFVEELRGMNVRPHVAQNTNGQRSAIDRRTTRHRGYEASQRIRKRIEEAFGWIKAVAGLHKTKLRGLVKVDWAFTFAGAAYNMVRAPKLMGAAP